MEIPKLAVDEVIYYDSEDTMKQEDIPKKTKGSHEDSKDKIKVKTEQLVDDTDDTSIDADQDHEASSDDENTFLDIIKKAANDNQFIFLNGVKEEAVVDSKLKPRKFMKRKKEYLSMEYWKKYRLSEQEAIVAFREKEHSDKYVKANYKCHNCLKGFSKVEMLLRHVKMKHDEVRLNNFFINYC